MVTVVIWDKCAHCGDCIPVCPENVYQWDYDGLLYADHENCIGCGNCVEACSYCAITFKENG